MVKERNVLFATVCGTRIYQRFFICWMVPLFQKFEVMIRMQLTSRQKLNPGTFLGKSEF
jgi:hypothetical protein